MGDLRHNSSKRAALSQAEVHTDLEFQFTAGFIHSVFLAEKIFAQHRVPVFLCVVFAEKGAQSSPGFIKIRSCLQLCGYRGVS